MGAPGARLYLLCDGTALTATLGYPLSLCGSKFDRLSLPPQGESLPMMQQQPMIAGLGWVVGILAGIGIATPLRAQIEDPSPIAPPATDEAEVGVPTPAPEGIEPQGTPEAEEVPLDQVILLTIDGETQYYAPVNLDASQLAGETVPTYTLGADQETSSPTSEDMTPEGREPMVTYPPADSLEDLDPEDIVE